MINLYLAEKMAKDKLREADKARLERIVELSLKDRNHSPLAQLACRFGLTQTC